MKQIYVADPREQRLLVSEANRPSAIVNILGSVLSMLPGLHSRQTSSTYKPSESNEQVSATPEASTIETTSNISNNIVVNNDGNTESEGNIIHNNTMETNTKKVFLNTRNLVNNGNDTANFHKCEFHQDDAQNSELTPIHTETMLRMHHAHHEMLNHYNCIVVGCF